MENASKALIIAGAVLLSILLVSIGIMIFNGATRSIGGAMEQMDATDIQAHNQRFTPYGGTKRGSEVKSLLDVILSDYQVKKGSDTAVLVGVTYKSWTAGSTYTPAGGTAGVKGPNAVDATEVETAIGQANLIRGDINTASRYKLEFTQENGIIVGVVITDV